MRKTVGAEIAAMNSHGPSKCVVMLNAECQRDQRKKKSPS